MSGGFLSLSSRVLAEDMVMKFGFLDFYVEVFCITLHYRGILSDSVIDDWRTLFDLLGAWVPVDSMECG